MNRAVLGGRMVGKLGLAPMLSKVFPGVSCELTPAGHGRLMVPCQVISSAGHPANYPGFSGSASLMVDAPGAQGATIVVNLPGEIDMANADRVGEELNAAFRPGVGVVIANLSGTRFCDTSGIHALLIAHQRAKAGNTGFRVVAGPGEVRRVLEILHLDAMLAIYPRLDVALLAGDRNDE